MDGEDSTMRRRRSLKERLGLNGMACCGAAWGLGPTNIISERDDDEHEQSPMGLPVDLGPNPPPPPCVGQSPAGMNLAAALAAERQLRDGEALLGPTTSPLRPNSDDERSPITPTRVSLMRLLEEEADGYDHGEMKKEEDEDDRTVVECDLDSVCCVCMVRKKGTAFIPCGHTFCRVCSRELWLTRKSCPLCNRTIVEILDIY